MLCARVNRAKCVSFGQLSRGKPLSSSTGLNTSSLGTDAFSLYFHEDEMCCWINSRIQYASVSKRGLKQMPASSKW